MKIQRSPLALVATLAWVAAIGSFSVGIQPGYAQKGGGGSTPPYNPEIVFTDAGIKVMNADGTNVRTIVSLARGDGANDPCWGPTGTEIAFTGGFSGKDFGLFTVRLDGTSRTKIVTSMGAANPRWSTAAAPNGQKMIAYTDYGPLDPDGYNQRDVFLVNPDGTGRINLTNSTEAWEWDCCWGADGSTLYITRDGNYYDLVKLTLGWDEVDGVRVVSEELIWSFGSTMYDPSIANTSSTLVFQVTGDPYSRIYQMDLQAQTPPSLLTLVSKQDETSPSFSPDDSKLVFWRGGAGGGIFTVNRDGTGEIRINAKGRKPEWKRPAPVEP